MRNESLGVTVAQSMVQKMRAAAVGFDLEHDGPYDCDGLTVGLWCGPKDRPSCWDAPITKGGLSFPREFVGHLQFDTGVDERATLVIFADPDALIHHRKRRGLSDREWKSLFRWLRQKVMGLLRLASLAPTVIGTQCPLCAWVLPVGKLLNELLDHVAAEHKDVTVHGLSLRTPTVLKTSAGEFELHDADRFD